MSIDQVEEDWDVRLSEHGRPAPSEVVVARRYLANGFIDTAMRIFERNVPHVPASDWALLVSRLMDGGRVADAVHVCLTAELPLPRQELLALGDGHLRRRNVDAAIRCYVLGDADLQRWADLVDVLTRFPGGELRATTLANRYLVARERSAPELPSA
jgi:hypothetical protein